MHRIHLGRSGLLELLFLSDTHYAALLHVLVELLACKLNWEVDVAIKRDKTVLGPDCLLWFAPETETTVQSEATQAFYFDIKDRPTNLQSSLRSLGQLKRSLDQ